MPVRAIRFGIPSLDELLGPTRLNGIPYGMSLGEDGDKETAAICIFGTEGTGKSVLALHLAFRYAADSLIGLLPARPVVLYASSDFGYAKASRVWKHFKLDQPFNREIPFCGNKDRMEYGKEQDQVKLKLLSPLLERKGGRAGQGPLSRFLLGKVSSNAGGPSQHLAEVGFIDISSHTAGDDWSFLNRLLAVLSTPEDDQPRHMLIIDSVDGLESSVGEIDAFGGRRSRRSGISQLARAASEKSHMVFVSEEPQEGSRLTEEFVSDVGIHLRRNVSKGYAQSTIEVQKVRGQNHVKGEHPLLMRELHGSLSDKLMNPDDPVLKNDYFHVYHSINWLHRKLMEGGQELGEDEEPEAYASFGIPDLDEMLGGTPAAPGLPVGKVHALIGDDGTHKSRLGRAFLSQCFAANSTQIPVLLTFQDLDRPSHATQLGEHLNRMLRPSERQRIVYRRLDIRETAAPIVFHTVKSCVRYAQAMAYCIEQKDAQAELLLDLSRDISAGDCTTIRSRTLELCREVEDMTPEDRYRRGRQVRLVIDDLSTLHATYPDVQEDPLFLPFLLFWLRREGVTALIVDSQPGSPSYIIREQRARELRALADSVLYTWHVPFFGETRVAITAMPPASDELPARIRELCPFNRKEHERLAVDPHFELYGGLEEGRVEQIPLKVRLFAETQESTAYHVEVEHLLRPLSGSLENGQGAIVETVTAETYETLRDSCHFQGTARRDYTQVVQVDEFWSETKSGLLQTQEYLLRPTMSKVDVKDGTTVWEAVKTYDPFGTFECPARKIPEPRLQENSVSRMDLVHTIGHDYRTYIDRYSITTVPYTWDFGFLLCREDAWEGADSDAMELLRAISDGKNVSWRDFLWMCRSVAEAQRKRQPAGGIFAYDVDMTATESFSCQVLEIWASEITKNIDACFPPCRHCDYGHSLVQLLKDHQLELYKSLLLLCEVIDPAEFVGSTLTLKSRPAHPTAVASRHWYSTASRAAPNLSQSSLMIPVGLPGHYSVRGDWFLAIAQGSRSPRQAEWAIDVLCSREQNCRRLELGDGLPTRRIGDLWTPLYTHDEEHGWSPLSYAKLREKGAYCAKDGLGRAHFRWLWRSLIRDYDCHARIWSEWLCGTLPQWRDWMWKDAEKSSARDGFTVYDALPKDESELIEKDFPGYLEFKEHANRLRERLEPWSSEQAKQLERSIPGRLCEKEPEGKACPRHYLEQVSTATLAPPPAGT